MKKRVVNSRISVTFTNYSLLTSLTPIHSKPLSLIFCEFESNWIKPMDTLFNLYEMVSRGELFKQTYIFSLHLPVRLLGFYYNKNFFIFKKLRKKNEFL
jgi:hypothetical protein